MDSTLSPIVTTFN